MTGTRARLLLAVLSATLLFLASRPLGTGYLAWFALVPLLVALTNTDRASRGALLGWIAWLGIGTTIFEGALPVLPWSFPILVAVSGLWWSAAGALYVWVSRKVGNRVSLLMLPFLVVALEYISSRRFLFGDLANALGSLGYTQIDTPLKSLATWSSMSGVSVVLVGLNVGVFLAIRNRRLFGLLPVGVVLIGLPFLVSAFSQASEQEQVAAQDVAIIQG